jgi:hypothetical protein
MIASQPNGLITLKPKKEYSQSQHAEKYQKLEMEKKKTRTVKKTFQGPAIHYHSVSMPIIEVMHQDQQESPITVDEGDDEREKQDTADVTQTAEIR